MGQSLKTRFVKAVCTDRTGALVTRIGQGQAHYRGAVFDVTGWEPHLAAAVAFRLYERAEARFALKYLGRSTRVLELGGNRGVVSSVLMQRLPADAQLVSVEANPSLVPDLKRNLARNAGRCRAEGRHLAVSDGSTVLFDGSRGSLGSAMSTTAGEPVPTTTLAELVDSLGWTDYSLLSDVEGAEAGFILGNDTGLERCTRLVAELHATTFEGRDVPVDELVSTLTGRHGFSQVARHRDVGVFTR